MLLRTSVASYQNSSFTSVAHDRSQYRALMIVPAPCPIQMGVSCDDVAKRRQIVYLAKHPASFVLDENLVWGSV